jgi:serine/threonine-protein kinase
MVMLSPAVLTDHVRFAAHAGGLVFAHLGGVPWRRRRGRSSGDTGRQGVLDWRVPGYRTVRDLAPRGRTGRSVLALHEASGLPVVVRYHAPSADRDAPAQLAALRADARALAGVCSPHIAPLYEHIEVVLDGRFGVATVRQYVDGASVRSLLRASLPQVSALSLLRAGLLALQAAHLHGVTHRAYSPENLLVDAGGSPRLADFATLPGVGAQDEPVVDVRAAFRVFVGCVTGHGRRVGRPDRLPRRLRVLAEPAAAGDGAALLDAVEAVGAAGWGEQWQARGEQELARLVARARPRRER